MSDLQNAFWDNTAYNAALAAKRSKPKFHIERGCKVKTGEVLGQVAAKGFSLSKMTLNRYQKAGLLPEPKIISLGRGGGKYADWPEETPAHLFAAYRLINGLMVKPYARRFFKVAPEGVSEARRVALNAVKEQTNDIDFISEKWLDFVSDFYQGAEAPPEVVYYRQFREKRKESMKTWEADMIAKYGSLPF